MHLYTQAGFYVAVVPVLQTWIGAVSHPSPERPREGAWRGGGICVHKADMQCRRRNMAEPRGPEPDFGCQALCLPLVGSRGRLDLFQRRRCMPRGKCQLPVRDPFASVCAPHPPQLRAPPWPPWTPADTLPFYVCAQKPRHPRCVALPAVTPLGAGLAVGVGWGGEERDG